jgi:hypothetical protein
MLIAIRSTGLVKITQGRGNYPHHSNAAKARTLLHKTISSMSA